LAHASGGHLFKGSAVGQLVGSPGGLLSVTKKTHKATVFLVHSKFPLLSLHKREAVLAWCTFFFLRLSFFFSSFSPSLPLPLPPLSPFFLYSPTLFSEPHS
jgi:hypothetical protein